MSMISPLSHSNEVILGICKHGLINLSRERPLRSRLRFLIQFVTKLVKIHTNLYPFLWVLLVFKYHFHIFILTWLFCSLMFISPLKNPSVLLRNPAPLTGSKSFNLKFSPLIGGVSQSDEGVISITPSFWGVSRRIHYASHCHSERSEES